MTEVSIETYEARLAKLLAALRSGNFKQGTGRLRRGDNYCCLGVACEVSGIGTWIAGRFKPDDGSNEGSVYLPLAVMRYYGFVQPEGLMPSLMAENLGALSTVNDWGASFPAIADLIEAHKFELFSWAGAIA